MTNDPGFMAQIIALLSSLINPTTIALGAFISQGLEQIAWFKREDVPAALKFLVVFLLCEVSAVVLALWTLLGSDNPTVTVGMWRMVFLTGVAITIGSQGFHLLINQYIPGLGDYFNLLLKALKLPADTIQTKTVSGTSGSSVEMRVITSTPAKVDGVDKSITPITGIPIAEVHAVLPPDDNG